MSTVANSDVNLDTNSPRKWIWLGSSNTRPFVAAFKLQKGRHFELCTKLDHFKSHLEVITKENCDYLIICGLDNVVADLSMDGTNLEKVEQGLQEFFNALEDLRLTDVKIVVGPLLGWKKHPSPLKKTAQSVIKDLKKKYPGILHVQRPTSLKFKPDGVHLEDRSGQHLYKAVFRAAEDFFNKNDEDYQSELDNENEDFTMDSEEEHEVITGETTASGETTSSKIKVDLTRPPPVFNYPVKSEPIEDDEDIIHSINNPTNDQLIKELAKLRRQVNARWTLDLIVMAGTKEDIDKAENNQNMNKVVITGLDVLTLWTQAADDWKKRIELIKDSIKELFHFIDPDHQYTLGYIKHLNAKIKGSRQIVEITLGSEEEGKRIRKAFAARIKVWITEKSFPEHIKGVSITPCLTLATRVRIEIMKAMAKTVRNTLDNHDAWVIQHVARPVMKIEFTPPGEEEKLTRSFGFAQGLAYLFKEIPGYSISAQDLFQAYSLAGTRFGPEISHHFIIMDFDTAMNMAKIRKGRKGKKRNE